LTRIQTKIITSSAEFKANKAAMRGKSVVEGDSLETDKGKTSEVCLLPGR